MELLEDRLICLIEGPVAVNEAWIVQIVLLIDRVDVTVDLLLSLRDLIHDSHPQLGLPAISDVI